jgi:glycosyltransferase involved in cell wall biosynthesis
VSEDLLAIARHDVNKNLPALFRGVALMQRRWPQWKGQMRIIGRSGRQTPLLYKLLNQLPRPEQVHLIEEVSQEQLVSLMRSSMALVSSSTEEGFNYPVLEAKAEGLPTLISDIPLHRELHHDSSLFFPTNDDGSCFSDQLRQLITDQNLWRHLSVQGVFLAKKMSIQHQKDSIRDLCAELIG